jgi:hypothetical protein
MGLLDDSAKVLRDATDAKAQADAACDVARESLRAAQNAADVGKLAVDAATAAVLAAAKAAGVQTAPPIAEVAR